MYKYKMIIDGTEYKALFENHIEANDFINENKADGSKVTDISYKSTTAEEILNDSDFCWAYRVELASVVLLSNHKNFKKWTELEDELKRLGYIN